MYSSATVLFLVRLLVAIAAMQGAFQFERLRPRPQVVGSNGPDLFEAAIAPALMLAQQ
jgi:hypothetical protein